jgi:hypothetical protein
MTTKNKATMTPKGKRLGRPPMAEETATLALRVPVELVDALDRYVVELGRQHRGITVTRNDTIRRLLIVGLEREGFALDEPKP